MTLAADVWEQNDTRATATNITSFLDEGYQNLNINSSTDQDWIYFYLRTNGTSENYISLSNISGGDLDLQLYSANGSLISYSNSTSSSETISLNGMSAGYYYARVYGYNGATGTYTFRCNLTPRTGQDAYEGTTGNNTMSNASTLSFSSSIGVINNLNIDSSSDVDYYRFTLPAAGQSGNYIGINLTHSYGDLDISLYNSSGSLISSSTSCSDQERISLSGLSSGVYYLRVYGYRGATGNYSIAYNLPQTAASIVQDTHESNNTMSTATNFTGREGTGTVSSLSIHNSSDVDYYKFHLSVTGRSSDFLKISFSHSAGDLDMELYNASGSLLRSSRSCSNSETISLSSLAAGDYYLRVYGYRGATGSYSLSYSLPVITDPYEGSPNNDSIQNASDEFEFGGNGNAYIASSTDVDYYKITLGRTGTSADKVRISFQHSAGDLDLYMYNSSGSLIKYSLGVTNEEVLSLSGYAAGTYYVKVVGYNGATGAYTLDVTLPSATVVGSTPDNFETGSGNNSFDTATDLRTLAGSAVVSSNLTIHSSTDEDFYKFSISQAGGSSDRIYINHTHSAGDLDIALYNSSRERVAVSLSSTDNESISLSGLAAGNYYLKVYGFMGATNTYSLGYSVAAESTVAADDFESQEPITIRQTQVIRNLSISPAGTGVTRADTFTIVLEAAGTASSQIVFSDYRSDWNGLSWQLKNSSNTVLSSGVGSTISLNGYAAGSYTLVVDTPQNNSYSNYSLSATLPTSGTGGSTGPGTGNSDANRWAVFIYVAADNNLESAALADLLEMQHANIDAGVEVYVLVDRANQYSTAQGNWTDTRVGRITHNTSNNIVVDWTSWGELNTGRSETLTRFLNWGASQAHASNYSVIMWDHGGSMYGGMSDNASNGDMLTMAEMRTGFTNAGSDFLSKLKVVGFDACLMGAAEVIESFNNIADYVVASEESIGNSGWNYTSLLNRLQGGMSTVEVATSMVDAGSDSSAVYTLSASKADGSLSSALNQFAAASGSFTASDWTKLVNAFRNGKSYSYSWMTDLVDVLNRITGASQALTNAVNTLKNALVGNSSSSDRIVLRNYADGSSYGRGNGIAVVNPVKCESSVLNYFTSNVSLGNSQWGNFLRDLANRATSNVGVGSSDSSQSHSSYTVARMNSFSEITLSNFSFRSQEAPYTASNLGVFSGRGMVLNDLFVSANDKQYFIFDLGSLNASFTALYDMEEGDRIVFNVDGGKSISARLLDISGQTVYTSVSGNGAVDLSLNVAGLNDLPADWNEPMPVVLEISSTEDVTYSLSFDAYWSTGVDYFDYANGGKNTSRLPEAGNNIISKATVLSAGSYGGLLTHSTDPDYYSINTARFNQNVTVTGEDLIVQVRDAQDNVVYTATGSNGSYNVVVTETEFLYVRGTRAITGPVGNNLSTYSISIGNRLTSYGSEDVVRYNDQNGSVTLLSDNGSGTFASVELGAAAAPWQMIGTGDFNGDMALDVLWRNMSTGDVGSWLGDGQYGVTWQHMAGASVGEWNIVGVGDFNGDATDDVLWYNTQTGLMLNWQVRNGQYSSDAIIAGAAPGEWQFAGTGDFNGDGTDDILWHNQISGAGGYWSIDNGTYSNWRDLAGANPSEWTMIGIGDFDANGFDDVLWLNNETGLVGCWANNSTGNVEWNTLAGAGDLQGWHYNGVGDYNGDGRSDVLWAHDGGAIGSWVTATDRIAVGSWLPIA